MRVQPSDVHPRKPCVLLLLFLIISLAVLKTSATIPSRDQTINNENKAIELINQWDYEATQKAVELLKKTAQDWEQINEPQKAVFCLIETAKVSQSLSDNQTIFRSLSQAISIANKNRMAEAEAVSLGLYAFFSIENSDEKNGFNYSRKSFLASENSDTNKAKAYAYFSRAIYEYYYGKMQSATSLFEESAHFARKTDDIFIINLTLSYVGFAYIRDGYPYKAVDVMNSALEYSQQFGYKRGEALSYFAISTAYYYIDKQKALDYLSNAESMFPTDFEWKEKARISATTGNLYLDLDYLELAENNFHKAILYHEKSNYLLGKVTALTLLADTYLQKNDLDKAKQIYESALTLSKLTNDKFRIGVIKEGLGNVEYKKNNFDDAIKYYFQALNIYDEIGVKLPIIENLIGNAYYQKGLHRKAADFYNSALIESRQNKDLLQTSESLFNFAKISLVNSDSRRAFNEIYESISITDQLYSGVNNSKLKKSYLSSVFNRYELYIDILMKMQSENSDKGFALQALQALERSRARVMMENLSLSDAKFMLDADAETIQREKEIRALLNAKADALTDLSNTTDEKPETDKITDEVNLLEHELEEIKVQLKQKSPVYSAIKNPAPFDVGEFQRDVLDDNSVLLEFSFGKDASFLWLVGKTSFESFVLPPRGEIESRVEKVRTLLGSRELLDNESVEDYQARIAAAEIEFTAESKELSRILFGQIVDKIKGKRLLIVPDGKLHYFPVAALPMPDSDGEVPILLTNETVYEPSAATLLLLNKIKKSETKTSKNLLIFSDPIFSAKDSRVSFAENNPADRGVSEKTDNFRFAESLSSLSRLIASKEESDSIVEIIGADKTRTLTGASATRESALDPSIADYQIIHFATHGLIKEDRPELSGIVLSQFDEAGQSKNGVVRLQDIYSMNLNANLVVLSACDTGIGKEVKGEGLMSLNNAFLQSGAKSVVSSLWKVDDTATRELMQFFYRELYDGKPIPEALRHAQIRLRSKQQYKSPFYWASFTVQGDFRSVPHIAANYSFWFYFLGLFPLAFLGFYLYKRQTKSRQSWFKK